MNVELGILGDLIASCAGDRVVIPRGMSQRLLLALAIDADRPTSDHELIDRLWGDTPPPNAIASLRNTVSRLRALLGADIIERHAIGYRLDRTTCSLDIDGFDILVDTARRQAADGNADAAAQTLDIALALVRGRPIVQVADEWWAMTAAQELAERIALAEELWAEVRLRQDRAGRELSRMHQAARDQPHRELRWRQVMQGLAAAGRRTEALRVADEAQRALAEFGLTPGPQIVALQIELLGTPSEPIEPAPTGNRLRAMRGAPIVGRDLLLHTLNDATGVAWLVGEPGIGKTRVLAEMAKSATDAGVAVLYGACERSSAAGTQLIIDIATEALSSIRITPSIPAELATLLGHDEPSSSSAHLEADIRRARIRTGVATLLTAAAADGPVLILADDMHWIDDDTADFLLYLLDRVPGSIKWVFACREQSKRSASIHLQSELSRRGQLHVHELEPLELDDLRELVDLLAPESDAATVARIVHDIAGASSGNALLATELIAHRLLHPADRTTPPRLDAIVASMVGDLSADDRDLVTTLAVAGPRCPPRLLANALGVDIDQVLATAQRIAASGLLSTPTTAAVDFRHEVLAGIVRRSLDLPDERAARHRLIDAASRDQRDVVALADHLVELGDLASDASVTQRHGAVAEAVVHLKMHGSLERAVALGRRYLALGGAATSPIAIEARLQVVTALIAAGEVAEGSALLDDVAVLARASGDPVLRTDAALASGPMQTGGLHANQLADEAEQLLAELPHAQVARRVQLACWAAHHRLGQGGREAALNLLAGLDALDFPPSQPHLQGLVLAVRAQVELMSAQSPGPTAARRALKTLQDYARRTDDEASEAAASLFGLAAAFMFGSLADVADARDRVERSSIKLPRPDLRWWPLVTDAAVLLATDQLDQAALAIDRAIDAGREMGVEMAIRTGLMQRSQHMLLSGQLGALTGMLEPQAKADDAPVALLAIYGSACVEADDIVSARGAAELLRARPELLASAGLGWTNVAAAASDLAHFAGDVELAESLWDELQRWSGAGLALMGAAYFGAADAALGRLALTMGRHEDGIALLTRALHQERARGAVAWERRVTRALDDATS